jgi:hypothetical protein
MKSAGLPKKRKTQMTDTIKRTTWLAASLALASALIGCQPPSGQDANNAVESELVATNGLTMVNGLTMTNGLSGNGLSGNGLSGNGLLLNPLATTGINSTTYLMNSADGRSTLSYLVRCALPAGRTITKTDSTGASYSFAGGIGLTPQWETGTCDSTCQQWISACMLAHVNTAGIHVPIWIVGQNSYLGWGQSASYPNQEGTFFGNIFALNTAGHTDAYYCEGPGFDKTVVDGRLGSNQVGAPYRDLFASGYCHINGCTASDSLTNGVADGYKACAMGDGAMNAWNTMITVWRDNKSYTSSGTVVAGTTADGRTVKYDFEGTTSNWTSGNTQLVISSSADLGGQTGTKALKVTYASGSSTVRMQSDTNQSIAAGTKVTFYLQIASNTALTSVTPWVRKNGSAESKQVVSVTTLLKGSWNAVTITVPSGVTANQVGVDFTTGGAFTAYVDSVTW